MLVEHRGMRPEGDPSAWIAATAVLCGDVRGRAAHPVSIAVMARVMPRQTAWLAPHRDDREL